MTTAAHTFIGILFLAVTTGGMAMADTTVLADRGQAAKLYYEAYSLRHPDAQSRLATAYASGIGVRKSDADAFYWSRRAAEQGVTDAQLALSGYYANGRGTPKDMLNAYRWAYVAGANAKDERTYQDATNMLELYARDMNEQQVASAVRLAGAWHPQPETAQPAPRPSAADASAQDGAQPAATGTVTSRNAPQNVQRRSYRKSERRMRGPNLWRIQPVVVVPVRVRYVRFVRIGL